MLRGQEIVQLEYFFDADPGYGNALQVPFTPDSMIDIQTTLTLDGLGDGLHTLYVRARDTTGAWSFLQKRSFIKDSTATATNTNITGAEYFFDIDPGYGNGLPLIIVPGSDILVIDNLALSQLTDGIHSISVRCINAFGHWSFMQKRSFIKDQYATGSPVEISELEFYIDEDPGFGNGFSLSTSDSTYITVDTVLDLTPLPVGIHTLCARVKNEIGHWSFAAKRSFLFDDERIEYAQFKFDSIPAYADWTVSNPFDPDFDVTVDIDFEGICDLDTGWYHIDARVRRELSWWSKEYTDSIQIKDTYEQTGLITDQFGDSIPLANIHVNDVGDFASDMTGYYSFPVPKCWGDSISLMRDSMYSAQKSYVFQNPVLDYSPHHILGDIDSTLYGYKCINLSGTIPLDLVYVCENSSLMVTKSGEVIDTGSISGYILHDGLNTLGTVYAMNLTGIFLNDGLIPQNQKLYVSPVVGRPGDPVLIHVDHECTDILLPGKPVVFLDVRDTVHIQLDSTGMFTVSPDTLLESDCSTCDIISYGMTQVIFSCADHGFNTETLTVGDNFGNDASCPLTISVSDTIVPVIQCRTDTLVHTDSGQCDYTIVNGLMDPISTWDNCPSTILNDYNHTGILDGAVLPLGTHLIRWTIDDAHGNTASCVFNITVEDHEDPEVVCATNATRSTDPDLCTYTVQGSEFDPVSVSDNCTSFTYWNDSTLTSSLSGFTFPLGVHPVSWIVDDGHGQYDTCIMMITVEDTEDPEIQCTASAMRSTDPGGCTYTIDGSEFDPVLVADNCSAFTYLNDSSLTASLDGFVLGLGEHTITWVVDDQHGQTASCAMTITVEDNETPFITCPADATRSTDTDQCDYTISGNEFDPVLVSDNCTDYTWSNNMSGTSSLNGTVLPPGTTQVTWSVDDQHGQTASCTVAITIEDNQAPVITCVSNAIRVTEPGLCYYTVNADEFDPPAYDDNCPDRIVTNDRTNTNTLAGEQLDEGIHVIVWTIDDMHGQTDTCVLTIIVEDNESPEIVCDADAVVHSDPGVCTFTIQDNAFDPVFVDDNCDDYTFLNSLTGLPSLVGAVLDTGIHVIVWTVDDQHGNTASCAMTITVEDHESPSITCPGNNMRNANPGTCSYTISGAEYDPLLVTDNCSDYFFFNNLNASSTLDGYVLPVGNHTIIWTVDDDHGQTASCSVSVMVEDNQAPSISCPSNQVRLATFGTCAYTTTGTEFDPVALSDNCDDYFTYNNVNFSSSLGGHAFDVGSHNITWVINDGHGHIQNCAFTINILDVQPPSIDCPDDITLHISSAVCDTAFTYTAVTSDNCPDEIVNLLSGTGSGNPFPAGISQEVLEVEDMSGNTASCAFNVTVNKLPDLVSDTICYGDSIYLEGTFRYLPGVFTDTLQNALACDSVVITTLDTTTYCIWPSGIVYVDSSATGENTGINWDHAYIDFQLSLDIAKRYFNVEQIWVAKGTYFTTSGNDRTIAFALSDSTHILGGFQGIETDSSERNPILHPVLLSGDIGVLDDDEDNSYHVVFNDSVNANVVLDGFVILNGNANGPETQDQSGAGIMNRGVMRLSNCRIEQCTSTGLGALIFNTGATAELTLQNITAIGSTPSHIWNTDEAEMILIGTIQAQ